MDRDQDRWASLWSVALALSGDPQRATETVALLAGRPRLAEKLGDSGVWRVLAGEALAPGAERRWAPGDPEAQRLWEAIDTLSPRERAAWVLAELGRADPNHIAIALGDDATPSSLESARAAVADRLGADADPGPLRAELGRVDRSDAMAELEAAAEKGRRRSRRLAAAQLTLLLVCFGLMIFVLVDLLGWDEERAAEQREVERLSNPLPSEDFDPERAP